MPRSGQPCTSSPPRPPDSHRRRRIRLLINAPHPPAQAEIIKLDRTLIAGIDSDQGQRALGAAMVGFAKQIGARIVAEGIETQAELTAVTELGMTSGQGYYLGRPTTHPIDWAAWREARTPDSNML
jgi:predicted signal transduction protein with EAL and GGDEF domain